MTQMTTTRDLVDVLRRDDQPAHFLWRGRLYAVRTVHAYWSEPVNGPVPEGDDGGRQVWRVTAAAGRQADPGQFDLSLDGSSGRWSLGSVASNEATTSSYSRGMRAHPVPGRTR